jgi:predicted nucleic acid-binding protein
VIRAVIDTNVLVSALISPSGNEALLLLGIAQGLVALLFLFHADGIQGGFSAP